MKFGVITISRVSALLWFPELNTKYVVSITHRHKASKEALYKREIISYSCFPSSLCTNGIPPELIELSRKYFCQQAK